MRRLLEGKSPDSPASMKYTHKRKKWGNLLHSPNTFEILPFVVFGLGRDSEHFDYQG